MKAVNPFKTDRSYEETILEKTSHLGPGLYFPEKAKSIGGSDFEKSRRAMYSTTTAKKATTVTTSPDPLTHTYSGKAIQEASQVFAMGQQSFGSSSRRFENINRELKK